MKKWIGLLVLALVVLAGALYYQQNTKEDTTSTSTPTPTATAAPTAATISYQGENGKTALELLQKNASAQTNGTGANAFVTTINGYTADDSKKEFWSYKVNGQLAEVGAGSYITKDSDIITWEIDTF